MDSSKIRKRRRITDVGGIVLIVYRLDENLDSIKAALTDSHFQLRFERSGLDVPELILSAPPDLILMEVVLSDTDGFSVCKRLKENELSSGIPVIFFSSREEVSEKLKAFSSGGVDYIGKPFNAEEIKARVRNHLTLRLQQKNLLGYERIVSATTDRIYLLDREYKFQVVNDAFLKNYQKTRRDILGKTFAEVIGRDFFEKKFKDRFDQTLAGENIYFQEWMDYESAGRQFISVACSPYYDINGNITGVLVNSRNTTDRKRAEEAILNAYNEILVRVVELSTLNSLMRTLSSVENLDSVLAGACEAVCVLFNARGAVISLTARDLQELNILAFYFRDSPEQPPSRVQKILIANDPIAGAIQTMEKALLFSGQETSPGGEYFKLLRIRDNECHLHVPLRARGEIIGMISTIGNQSDRDFNRDEVKLMETIAGQIGGAVENVRLLGEEHKINSALSAVNRRIEEDMSFAREIQFSLLRPPRPEWSELDVICYMMPARSVGGDFYAYHAFPDGRYALAVGDVSGKGVPAALLMATCLSQFDASLHMQFEPVARFNHLDQAIMPYTRLRGQNCALIYSELKPLYPERGTAAGVNVSLVNAGCIPPFIKRADGSVDWPSIGGLPLGQGLGSRMGYRGLELVLAPGDLLILTSDGVAEAGNQADELLGFESLKHFVERGPGDSALVMLEYLKGECFAFMQDVEQHDDITILVVRI